MKSAGAEGTGVVQATPAEAAHLAWLADIGELTGPLAHEFNNVLNNLVLYVAVLEQHLQEHQLADLTDLRREIARVSGRVRHFLDHRRSEQQEFQDVDLNDAVRVALEAIGEAAPKELLLDLTPTPPPVGGFFYDLARLCRFLFRSTFARVAQAGGTVRIKTEERGGKVRLRIDVAGPPLPAGLERQLFEPGNVSPEGMNALELAACKPIVRRFQGALHAQNQPVDGWHILVELPVLS